MPQVVSGLVIIIVFGTIYGVTQQAQRSEANYPQIQLAEDTAAALNRGEAPAVYGDVDAGSSLAPFTIIYDKKGREVVGSGHVKGKVPTAPIEMLKAAEGQDYHATTWEPAKGPRIAAVTVAAKEYYVLSGRSLREVEKTISQTAQLSLLGGLLSLLLLGGAVIINRLTNNSAGPGYTPSAAADLPPVELPRPASPNPSNSTGYNI